MHVAFNLRTAAEYMEISVPTLRELLSQTDFPAFKSGRRWIIPRDALIRWLNDRAEERAQL